MNKKQIMIAVASVCSIAIIGAAGAIGFYFGQQSNSSMAAVETVVIQAQKTPSIAIPGFDSLTMKEGQADQKVKLYNPEQNKCYFVLSIYLQDGKEIFHSSKLAPGEELNKIKLAQPLKAGTYKGAKLRYYCYDFEDLQPLNGADINFTLEVKP